MSNAGDHLHGDLMTLQPGQLVGRYRITNVLGQGGFGITYRAFDAELNRQVAIKEYLPAALAIRQDQVTVVPRSQSAASDLSWGLERFVTEGRTLAALHHAPGIVKVHDFLQANGTAYLVMELVRGETLLNRIERSGPLDEPSIETMLGPLLDGLEQVHAAGFLHRDIKPANILIDGSGRPTLIDFGASRAAVAGRSQAMTAVFTPGYAPVEQFTSAPQGPWTDIYSLAATLYHAVTGTPPHNAVDRMLEDTFVPLASERPFRPGLLAGLNIALSVRAADRPQSVSSWRQILFGDPSSAATVAIGVNHSMSQASSELNPTRQSKPPTDIRSGPSRKGLIAAGGVGLLLALTAAWALTSPGAKSPPSVAATPLASDTPRPPDLLPIEQQASREAAGRTPAAKEAQLTAEVSRIGAHAVNDADATARTDGAVPAAARNEGPREAEGTLATQADKGKTEPDAASRPQPEPQKQLAQAPAPAPSAPMPSTVVQSAPAAPQRPPAAACEGSYRSQWCRSAYQGFPANCWDSTMSIRNRTITDGWSPSADPTRRNVVTGTIDANGDVSLTYEGYGQQTHINQRFTALMAGRVESGVLRAAGRAGAAGREFTVTVVCR